MSFLRVDLQDRLGDIEFGSTPDNVVRFSNLDSVRTIADVRDSVRA